MQCLKVWKVIFSSLGFCSVVENDYELRKKRDEFLDYLEREQYEGLKAIAEWRAYLKTRTGSNEDIGVA